MEAAVLIHTLVGVRAEAITHGLHQVLGQAIGAITIDVIQRAAEARHRNAGFSGASNNLGEPWQATGQSSDFQAEDWH